MIAWLLPRFVLRRARAELPRLALLAGGVALGVAIFIAIVFAGEASLRSFEKGVWSFSGGGRIELRGRLPWMNELELGRLARALTRDFRLLPMLEIKAHIFGAAHGAAALTLLGVEAPPFRAGGGMPRLAISRELAGKHGLSEGSALELAILDKRAWFEISKLVPGDDPPLPPGVALADLGELQAAAGLEGRLSSLGLLPRRPELSGELAAGLAELPELRNGGYAISGDVERRERAERLSGAFRTNVLVLVILTLAVAAFTVFNSARLSMLNVTREISILRTLGLPRRACFLLLISEAALVGACGAALGLTLGKPVTDLAAGLFLDTTRNLYGAGGSFDSLGLGSSAALYLLAFAAGLATCLAGALYPAWRASQVSPGISARARQDQLQPASVGRSIALCAFALACALGLALAAGALERVELAYLAAIAVVAALLAGAPFTTRASLSSLKRPLAALFGAPGLISAANVLAGLGSSALAVAGNALGLSLLLALGVMIGSFRATLAEWVSDSFRADLFVKPLASGADLPGWISRETAGEIGRIAGVASVERYVAIESELSGEPLTLAGTDLPEGERFRSYRILEGSLDRRALQSGAAVLVSETARAKLGLRSGSSVRLAGKELTVAGVYKDFARERASVLFALEPFIALYPVEGFQTLSVYLEPGSAGAAAKPLLEEIAAMHSLAVTGNSELKELVFRIFDQTFAVTRLMSIVVALICGFGFLVSLSQHIYERRAEIKTLVFMGASARDIHASILLETGLIALPSLILGVAGGAALAYILVALVNPLSFGWTLEITISPGDLLLPAALIVGANLCVGIGALWKLSRVVSQARVSDE